MIQSPQSSPISWLAAYESTGQTHGLFRGLPAIILGVVLALASQRLATWIVRPPDSGCLSCGHTAR